LYRKARRGARVALKQGPDLAVDRIPVQSLLRLGDTRLQFPQRLLDARAEALVHRLFLLEAILRSTQDEGFLAAIGRRAQLHFYAVADLAPVGLLGQRRRPFPEL